MTDLDELRAIAEASIDAAIKFRKDNTPENFKAALELSEAFKVAANEMAVLHLIDTIENEKSRAVELEWAANSMANLP